MSAKEMILHANILSEGIAIGKPIFLGSKDYIAHNLTTKEEIKKEIKKYKAALKKSEQQILDLKKNLAIDKLSITFDILNTHLELLKDPLIAKEIENRIIKDKKNVEAIFEDILLEYQKKIKDAFFKERIKDIKDVFKRISTHLRSIKVNSIKKNKNAVFLSNEVIPSDVFSVDKEKVSAFISYTGGYASHAAIIARSKNIPFVSKVNIEKLKKTNLKKIIVDAVSGKIILNPTSITLNKYLKFKEKLDFQKLTNRVFDHKNIQLFANISSIDDVDLVIKNKAKGIGLFRSEFLILEKQKILNEKEQFEIYKNIAGRLQNKPFIIRLFDIGGDKNLEDLNFKSSDRGIKFLLKHKKILKDQIKAVLKANLYGNISILLPLVSDAEEIKQVKKHISEIKKDLIKANLVIKNIKIGSMIEVPSAAFMIEDIIKHVDFVSIGTNDLTRYMLALDYNSEKFDKIHPSVAKLIEMIVATAKKYKKTAIICGEAASLKCNIQKLLDLKIFNFSIAVKKLSSISHEIDKILG